MSVEQEQPFRSDQSRGTSWQKNAMTVLATVPRPLHKARILYPQLIQPPYPLDADADLFFPFYDHHQVGCIITSMIIKNAIDTIPNIILLIPFLSNDIFLPSRFSYHHAYISS